MNPSFVMAFYVYCQNTFAKVSVFRINLFFDTKQTQTQHYEKPNDHHLMAGMAIANRPLLPSYIPPFIVRNAVATPTRYDRLKHLFPQNPN